MKYFNTDVNPKFDAIAYLKQRWQNARQIKKMIKSQNSKLEAIAKQLEQTAQNIENRDNDSIKNCLRNIINQIDDETINQILERNNILTKIENILTRLEQEYIDDIEVEQAENN